MPEMPEVETVAEGLRREPIWNSPIQRVEVWWERSVLPNSVEQFKQRLLGSEWTSLDRRGKNLLISLTRHQQPAGFLHGHLRMTGKFFVCAAEEPPLSHERIAIVFHNGSSLRFCDPRKFGRMAWMASVEELNDQLGPEPLQDEWTLASFQQILGSRSRMLKPLLLDQKVIAGLGNIYVDEALWLAGLHPMRRSDTLTVQEVGALFDAIRASLRRGLALGGTSLGKGLAYFQRVNGESGGHQQLLQVFRRTGEPCERCGHPIERIVVAQRSTHLCPVCQKRPKPSHSLT
jgi:formamidopyrimidine-DNA glycosylase